MLITAKKKPEKIKLPIRGFKKPTADRPRLKINR